MTLNKEENVNYKFTPGDVVKVRNMRGPDMCVRETSSDRDQRNLGRVLYHCVWFEGGEGWWGDLKIRAFHEEELELSSSYEFLSTDDEIL